MRILYTTNEKESPMTWQDFLLAFDQMLDEYGGAGAIMIGTVGRWDGDYPGGCHIESSDDIFPFLKDCETIVVYEEDERLYITASHHDGTNRAEIRMLTDKGADWYESYSEMMPKKEAMNTLMLNNVYTTFPDLSFFERDKEEPADPEPEIQPGMKRLCINMYYTYVGDTYIDVPANMSLEEAIQYAKKNINDIPLAASVEYVKGSDSFDDDDCDWEEEV